MLANNLTTPLRSTDSPISNITNPAPTTPILTKYNKIKHHATMVTANIAGNAVLGGVSGAIGYPIEKQAESIEGITYQQFILAMALGQAVLSVLPYYYNSQAIDFEKYENPKSAQFISNLAFPLLPMTCCSLIAWMLWVSTFPTVAALLGTAMLQLYNKDQFNFIGNAAERGTSSLAGAVVCLLSIVAVAAQLNKYLEKTFTEKTRLQLTV